MLKNKRQTSLKGENVSRKTQEEYSDIVKLKRSKIYGQKSYNENGIISPTMLKKVIGKVSKRYLKDDYILKFSDIKWKWIFQKIFLL